MDTDSNWPGGEVFYASDGYGDERNKFIESKEILFQPYVFEEFTQQNKREKERRDVLDALTAYWNQNPERPFVELIDILAATADFYDLLDVSDSELVIMLESATRKELN